MAISSGERSTGKTENRGNPYRCKICNNLASADLYCTPCRTKLEAEEDYPLDRKVYKDYGGSFGRKTPFFSRDGFGVVKKDYGITKKRW